MAKVLVAYYTKSGNTKKMADIITNSILEENLQVICKNVEEVNADELLNFDAIILGSPTYYGSMAWQIKKLLDDSVKFHGKLEGKIGAAFSSAANIGGGNETTILNILHAMLIHGMIIKGYSKGDHYGVVSIDSPDERVKIQCRRIGKEVANLINKIF